MEEVEHAQCEFGGCVMIAYDTCISCRANTCKRHAKFVGRDKILVCCHCCDNVDELISVLSAKPQLCKEKASA